MEQQKQCIASAVKLTEERMGSDSAKNSLYEYIHNQLTYISSCLEDKSYSREKLADVNLGRLSVREFEGKDDEYADLLKRAFFIVHYIRKGTRVPLLDKDGNIVK
jgi:hypothetical protein